MPRFSNRPFLATTLSFLSSRAKPRDLRCAIRVPRSYRPTTSTNITESSWKHQPPLCHSGFPGEVRGTADPLGFAPPDFLLRLVALANFMRLSLRERRTRNRVQRSVAGNPGRDDKKERVVARKGRLLNRGIFQIEFGQLLLNLAQD